MRKMLLVGKRILCVDDDEAWCRVVRDELELHGAIVAESKNGIEAYNLAQEDQFDAIISDARMPGGNGIDLLENIRRSHPKIPFFFLSGDCPISREEVFIKGANAFFDKPCEFSNLVKAIVATCESANLKWTRRHDRLSVNLAVGLKTALIAIETNTTNIGRGGMFINVDGDSAPHVGERIDFELSLSDDNEGRLSGNAVVRWRCTRSENPGSPSPGIGVEFTSVSDGQISSLIARLEHAYEDEVS
jgi:CheY-like chemotaxis protein